MILDKLQKFGAREKMLMAFAGLFVIALIIDYGVVEPMLGRYNELNRAIETAERDLVYNRNVLRQKDRVRGEYDSVCDLLARSSLATEDIDTMKGEVEEMANRAGIQFNTMTHSEPGKNEFYDEYRVEMGRYEADMQNILVFLHQLNQTPGMLRVSRMNIKPVKGGDRVTGSITISKVLISNQGAEDDSGEK